MIRRVVRMAFQEDKTEEFEAIFESSKELIRAFEGCEYLSLHRDHYERNVYYTLSHWKSQGYLDDYRNSSLFQDTWNRTKVLFKDKPLAFSLDQILEIP